MAIFLSFSQLLLLSTVPPNPNEVAVGPVAEADVVVLLAARESSNALSCTHMSTRTARSSSACRFHPCASGVSAGADMAGAREALCFDSKKLSATRRNRRPLVASAAGDAPERGSARPQRTQGESQERSDW